MLRHSVGHCPNVPVNEGVPMTTCPQTFSPAVKRFHGRLAVSALVAAASMAVSFQAAAVPIVQVANRAAMGADYTVTWAGPDVTQLGPFATVLGVSPLPSVTATAADLWLFEQGGAYIANFAAGDKLLTTFTTNGPITLSFSSAVRGVGFNIAHLEYGAFIGTMEFFDVANTSLGVVNIGGISSNANDGTAAFLGGVGSALDIRKVVIAVDLQRGNTAFAINDLSLVTTPVPESTSALLFAFGLAGLALHRKQRSSAPH
jgi:hypothetical protein